MRLLLAVAVTVCATTSCFGNARPCTVPKDEMQVVRSYLKWAAEARDATVLVTTTEASKIDVDYANVRLAIGGNGVPVDVRNDLKRKQESTCAIRSFTGVPNLQFISQHDYDLMFRARNGWSKFHKRYGKDASLVSMSRVGFNSERTIALFHVTAGIGPMAGGCYIYVFRLRGGKWIKDAQSPIWNT